MPKHYLQRLIDEGEHQQQDFKYKVTDACKLAKSVSAFANTDGGRLLVGVRDDGHLSGVRSEEEIYMLQEAATHYCHPASDIKFETFVAEGRTIVVATVPKAQHKPIKALGYDGKWKAYIRVADENIVASPVHLRIWRDEETSKGILVNIGDEEQQVMQALKGPPGITLRQVERTSGVGHHRTVNILAKLVRFELVQCQFYKQHFAFYTNYYENGKT